MNEKQLQHFNQELIDIALRWVLAHTYAGYSMHGSLIHATKFVLPPNQDVWRQAMSIYMINNKQLLVWEVLAQLQVKTQSEGLKMLIQHGEKTWNGPYRSQFNLAIEPALDRLWSDYDGSTKPDSVRFNTALQWLRDMGTDDTARRQFDRMETHALPYFEAAVYYGAAHDPTTVLAYLRNIQNPHAHALINRLEQQSG